jgi:hypothetical protein
MSDTFIFTDGLASPHITTRIFQDHERACKDYATFFSYVIARHGYYAEMVTFTSARYNGHVVTIFKDEDGQFQYQSNEKLMGKVSSIDDLLQKEMKRLGYRTIIRYKVLPPGSVNVCTTVCVEGGTAPCFDKKNPHLSSSRASGIISSARFMLP